MLKFHEFPPRGIEDIALTHHAVITIGVAMEGAGNEDMTVLNAYGEAAGSQLAVHMEDLTCGTLEAIGTDLMREWSGKSNMVEIFMGGLLRAAADEYAMRTGQPLPGMLET